MYSARTVDLFFQILYSVLTNTTMEMPEDLNEHVDELLSLAKAQEVFLIIYQGIKNIGGNLRADIQTEVVTDLYYYAQNKNLLDMTKKVLSEAGISYVPLKGAVIKVLYPEPWMRRYCDIDVLVKEKDLKKAVRALVNSGFSTDYIREYHDVSLYYGEAHLELHFNICENFPRIDSVLNRVWKNLEQVSEYEYRETPAFYTFHSIAHLLYHLLRGGCSIKQFIDLWLLRKMNTYEEKDLIPLLKKCKLEKFYRIICELTDVWFDGCEPTELTLKLENIILKGGFAGNANNSDAVSIAMSGGKLRYLIQSTFIPLHDMKWYYPALRKYPLLLPLYYCRRLYSKTLGGERERARKLLKISIKKDEMHRGGDVELIKELV